MLNPSPNTQINASNTQQQQQQNAITTTTNTNTNIITTNVNIPQTIQTTANGTKRIITNVTLNPNTITQTTAPFIIQNGNIYQLTSSANLQRLPTNINITTTPSTTSNTNQNSPLTNKAPANQKIILTTVKPSNSNTNPNSPNPSIIIVKNESTSNGNTPSPNPAHQKPKICYIPVNGSAPKTLTPTITSVVTSEQKAKSSSNLLQIPLKPPPPLTTQTQAPTPVAKPNLTSILTSTLQQQQPTPPAPVKKAQIQSQNQTQGQGHIHQVQGQTQSQGHANNGQGHVTPVPQPVTNNTPPTIITQIPAASKPQSKLNCDHVIADSRILTSSAPNFEALLTDLHDANNGVPRVPANNEQITYKIVRLNNVEHVILDNAHHLANFRGQQAIERLYTFAGMLAAKLNRPVTIPAFLMLENNFDAVESGVRGLLNRDPHQSTRLDPLMVSTGFEEILSKSSNDTKKENPELSALLSSKDDLPYKINVNTNTNNLNNNNNHMNNNVNNMNSNNSCFNNNNSSNSIQNNVKAEPKLESFGQLANAILTQRNVGKVEKIDDMLSIEPKNLMDYQSGVRKDHEIKEEKIIESLGVLNEDYDFGFDPFDTNAALFNNMDFNVGELDFDGMPNGLLTSNNPAMAMMPTSMLANSSNLFSINMDNEDEAADGEERFRVRNSAIKIDD